MAVLIGYIGAVAVRHVTGGGASPEPTSSVAEAPSGNTLAPSTNGLAPDEQTPGAAPSTTTPPSGGSGSGAAASADLVTGVVNINSTLGYQRAQASGTGMVLTANGDVLTNNHVIQGATAITVQVISTGKTYTATVLGTSPHADIAVLHLNGASGLTPAQMGTAKGVAIGDPVTAVGNALGRGTPTKSSGTVVNLGQTITASDSNGGNQEMISNLIEVNALLQPGDSGGPLYSAAGKVIGINTAASSSGFRNWQSTRADGYAITIDAALDVAHQIEAGQASANVQIGTPGFLGIATDPTAQTDGAAVMNVSSGTPAAGIGLKAGDVITSFDNQPIHSADALSTAIHAHKPNDTVPLGWTSSDGSTHQANVRLAAGPAN